MNQEEILKMAREAGAAKFYPDRQSKTVENYLVGQEFLERFAALVAAKAAQDEREACASVADAERWNDVYPEEKVIHDEACQEIAAVIRARGQ